MALAPTLVAASSSSMRESKEKHLCGKSHTSGHLQLANKNIDVLNNGSTTVSQAPYIQSALPMAVSSDSDRVPSPKSQSHIGGVTEKSAEGQTHSEPEKMSNSTCGGR